VPGRIEERRDEEAGGPGDPGPLSRLLQEIAQVPSDEVVAAWSHALEPGARVGRFEIRGEIGRGGFGSVYAAFDPELGREVALKALRPRRTGRELSADWIRKEAEAVARLNHPCIVTLHDVGNSPAGPYLVMELLRGETLADRVEKGPLPLDEALRVADEVARGLAHAHAHGVLHRDLKPANAFLCEDGSVKILDFGLAHLLGSGEAGSGGTPAFMAPEQARGEPVDERADVYALGTMLFQLLTGRLPYAPGDERGVPAGGRAPEVPKAPAALARLLDRMLARDPSGRMANGQEAHAALSALRKAREPRRRAWLAWSLASVALVAAVSFALRPPKIPPGRIRTAVADLENRTGDPRFDGAGELFREALEQSRRVALLSRASLVSSLREGGAPVPSSIGEADALTAARRAQAQMVLVPSIRPAGNGFELGVSAVNVARGDSLFGLREQVVAAASLYEAIDRIVLRVRKALAEEPGEAPRVEVGAVDMAPANAEALRLHAEGKRLQSESNYDEAKKRFLAAAKADPEFPLPQLEILQSVAGVYMTPIRMTDEERSAHVEALRRNLHRLPASERPFAEYAVIMAEGGYQDGTELLAAIDRLIEARPEDARPYILAGNELIFWRGDIEAARPYVDRALALSPPEGLGDVIDFLVLSGRLDEALTRTRRWVEQAPGPPSHSNLAMVLHARGETRQAISVVHDNRVPTPEVRYLLVDADAPDEVEADLRARMGFLPAFWLAIRGRVRDGIEFQEAGWAKLAAKGGQVPAGQRFVRIALNLHRGEAAGVRAQVEELYRARGSKPIDAWILAEAGDVELAGRLAGVAYQNHRLEYRMVRAIGAWKKGQREKALQLFQAIAVPTSHLHQGEILLELGRNREALQEIRAYRGTRDAATSTTDVVFTSWNAPRAILLEAVALERLGEIERSRSVNDQFLRLWGQADDDLPLLADAKALQARLAGGSVNRK
jgi:eukaryotic-like serine/threonine-protein kinase